MLTLRNINKSYGNLRVLKDINLNIGDSEIVALLGPSGAGKSTLLHIAGSLDTPDSGEVIFNGESLTGMKSRKLDNFRCHNIGFIFQFHELLPEFTAKENVALPAMIAGKGRKESYRLATELLKQLNLGDRLDHKPSALSGGEKQRTAIARALVNSPGLILADEPTGSLDTHNRDEILTIIETLRRERGQAFLIVTHDTSLTRIADRVVHMSDGLIVREESIIDTTPELKT